eukprot:Anaeramoba_ignava/a617125_24.p1 GENE.a617125_24~~a617125_24.p1  ORF type:complete len:324 (-),score=103.94 a617125_24:340-1224(-)
MKKIEKGIYKILYIGNRIETFKKHQTFIFSDQNMSVLWKTWDQTLNFTSFDGNRNYSKNIPFDEVIKCCHCTKDGKYLILGGSKCLITIWKISTENGKLKRLKMKKTLYGHTDSILSIDSSCEHRIIVTGSADGTAIIWDLNDFTCCYSLNNNNNYNNSKVNIVCIDSINGDILTFNLSSSKKIPNSLNLWSINGVLIKKILLPQNEIVTSAIFSSGISGIYHNVIFTGMKSGSIEIWDSLDLTHISSITTFDSKYPITALLMSFDQKTLYSGNKNGDLIEYSLKNNSNSFLLI